MIELKRAGITLRPNYIKIPCTRTDDADAWNEIYLDIRSRGYNRLTRTPSGGISLVRLRLPAYDVRTNQWGVELVVGDEHGWFRLQFRQSILSKEEDSQHKITGKQSLKRFGDELKAKLGINLADYKISREEGIEIKKEIEKPLICMGRESWKDLTWEHVNHLDINSSYPAGLSNAYPEFTPLIQEWYQKKKSGHVQYKAYLNLVIGTMQSPHCGYKYAHLSKVAIAANNEKVKSMAKYVHDHNGIVLLYNTDGFWYIGCDIPESMLSTELGGWKMDHKDCTFRMKSAGAYEFIENGIYTPVIRGKTKLDRVQPDRTKWHWGDIYSLNAEEIYKYIFTEEYGLEGTYEREELE